MEASPNQEWNLLEIVKDPNLSVERVQAVLRSHPESIHLVDEDQNLPLHIAIEYQPLEVIKVLAEANLDALKIPNNQGRLPVYLSCCKSRPGNIIKYLIDLYPEGLQKRILIGRLPIHVACYYLDDPVILYMAEVYPESLRLASVNARRLPIHYSCWESTSPSLIESLIDMYPECLLVKDITDNTPVNILALYNVHHDVTIHVAQRCPESLSIKCNGLIPIQHLITQSSDFRGNQNELYNVASQFLKSNPRSFEDAESISSELIQAIVDLASDKLFRLVLNYYSLYQCIGEKLVQRFSNINWETRAPALLTVMRSRQVDVSAYNLPQHRLLSRISKDLNLNQSMTANATPSKINILKIDIGSQSFIILRSILSFL